MASQRANWDRWIFASCATYFDENKGNYELYIEGQDRRVERESDYAEMRYNGPRYLQSGPLDYTVTIELNMLVNAVKDQKDDQKIFRICGFFESLFIAGIPVYMYGDNDTQLLGCLQRKSAGDHEIIVTHYGQVSPDVRVLQSTIEATYFMLLNDTK